MDTPITVNMEQNFVYHVLRYTPNLVRDEWVNIGVLLFNSDSGERRLRLIEEEEEDHRVGGRSAAARFARRSGRRSRNGTRLFPTLCSWPRRKGSLRLTWMPNSSGSTPTMCP
jgi:hypothetical protein